MSGIFMETLSQHFKGLQKIDEAPGWLVTSGNVAVFRIKNVIGEVSIRGSGSIL
jgi:hypothetical protein